MNILAWNIKVGQNKDGSYPLPKTENLDRIVDIIKDSKVSIACLQEVDAYTLRSGIKIHQASYIANKLRSITGKLWNYEYIVSRKMKPGYYGNAILSYYPMTTILKIPLPRINSKEDRSFLLTKVYVENLPMYIGTFHLGLQGDQSFQAKTIKNVLKDYKFFNKRIILGGDLNDKEGSNTYYIMLNQCFPMIDVGPLGICTFNCFHDNSNPKIDFFFIRGFANCNIKSSVLPIDISDHRPIRLSLQ
ncbi:endonuclease/exonuclease/phosphatase family protein [Tepidimicrobium xylanilyticum]|nr:endonuclease/exonuclease/phosphatase family protein [Tepidimicrobium xylanilyticum]